MKELKGVEEFEKVIGERRFVVIDFYADWCLPCKYLTSILEKLEKNYRDLKFYKLNVDKNIEIAFRYGITSIPTVLIFYNGKVVGGFIGAMSERDVVIELERSMRKVHDSDIRM